MRVAVVGPAHPFKGGGALHSTELAHRLAGAGHDVALESWSAQYPKLFYPGQLTVDAPEMPLFEPTRHTLSWRNPFGWLRQGARIGRASDVVVLQLFSTTVQALPYLAIMRSARRAGARVVLIAHNVVPHEARAVDRFFGRVLYRRADLVLVHSEELSALVGELAPTPVVVAPLAPHPPRPERTDTGADADALHDTLLFFGLIRPYKGVDVLLRALARASCSARLIVAGEVWGGGGADDLRALVTELRLDDRVTLREGYVDVADLPALFAACDALVLPYRHATGSQNAQLAFEYERPVIVTRTGALADAVSDGVDAIVCKPDDVDSLAAAIERFYAPGEALRLRGNVKRPESGAAWAAYLEALLSVPNGG